MNILTIGASPYQFTSNGVIHSEIIKHLYLNGNGMVSAVWGHDTSYFVPEEENGKKQYFFEFEHLNNNHKIPIVPFRRGKQESVAIYEIMQSLNPDLVITIGDFFDFLFMKSVKQFYPKSFKWLWVMNNYSNPLHEKNIEIFEDVDAILCINNFTFDLVSNFSIKGNVDKCYFGSSLSSFAEKDDSKFRIMANAKNIQTDNLPNIMKAVYLSRTEIPEIELYCHSNVYDNGDYDLSLIRERFDPKEEFIKFPEKFISVFDGLSNQELALEYSKSHIFISASMASGSGLNIFDSMACGCLPIVSNNGINFELAKLIIDDVKIPANCVLINGSEFMSSGETYLYATDAKEISKNILKTYYMIKNIKGELYNLGLYDIVKKYSRSKFLSKLLDMIKSINTTGVICVEPV